MPSHHRLQATSTKSLGQAGKLSALKPSCTPITTSATCQPAVPGVPGSCSPYLLHFGHIPDEGFVIHVGEQFAQLVQV